MKRNRILSILLIFSILLSGTTGLFNVNVVRAEDNLVKEINDTISVEESANIEAEFEIDEGEEEFVNEPSSEEYLNEEETSISEEEKIGNALDLIYNAFSGHGSSNPIPFPYGEGEGEYKNAVDFIEARARELVPEYDVKFIYSSTLAGTVGTTDILKQTTMDAFGNITPVYNGDPSKPAFMGSRFSIEGIETKKNILLYLAVDPISVTEQEMVDKEASAIVFDLIKGKNSSQEYITSSLGRTVGSNVNALNTAPELYKNDVQIKWSLEHIEGNTRALSLGSDNRTGVIRPNVDENDARFKLKATVSHKINGSAKTVVEFDLRIPAFVGYKVPLRITPKDAKLEITDSYYGGTVEEKYINLKENGELREVSLHGNATDGSQSYSYTVSKEGYISKTGRFSVNGEDLDEMELSLVPSSSNDRKLESLIITSPTSDSPSIISPMEDFHPETKNYTMTVGNIQSITIQPTVMTEGATIVVNAATSRTNSALKDYNVSSGSTRICYLFEGENIIKITVKAPASSTQEIKEETYILKVVKNSEEDYPLSNITIKANEDLGFSKNNHSTPQEGILSPKIDTGGIAKEYSYYVNSYTHSVDITPVADNAEKVEYIKINGTEVNETLEKHPLEYGNNHVEVVVKLKDVVEPYIYNLNIRRKYSATIKSYSADGYAGRLTNWTGQANFLHSSTEVNMIFDIEEEAYLTIDGIEGKYYRNEIVPVPIGDSASDILIIRINRETVEEGKHYVDTQAYIIGLYRMASSSPDGVESYLPAPGQFVNQGSYRDPMVTLRPNPSMVTLGAFGGSIVYKFDEPIKNDPTNPYGIDFIVYGNVFRNTDGTSARGASEPAAVMVSKDGENWYELAGSLYYDATTRHNVEVSYTNPDPTFTQGKDIPWEDNEGNKGFIKQNASHNQSYYPNPVIYSQYNSKSSVGYNSSYSDSMVKFTGSMLLGTNSPAFGYGDTHANSEDYSRKAVNPYIRNHYAVTNGDGMDIAWAVDHNGNPVELDEVHYVRIYNPNMHMGGTTGEISPEIAFLQKVEGQSEAVGVTDDLKTLTVSGKEIELVPGKYNYTVDIEGASSFNVNAILSADSNIWVNDNWIKSGADSPYMLAGKSFRIVAQEGIKEPVIYIINIENGAKSEDNAEIENIVILPGDINAARNGKEFYAEVDSNIASIAIQASPLSGESKVYINSEEVYKENNWQSQKYIQLTPGEYKAIIIEIVSQSGITETYELKVLRENPSEEDLSNMIQVHFKLVGDTKHGEGQHTGYITWISREKHSLPKGSTVKYLTDMVLASHGIPFKTNSVGTYIESINGLGEFDNGPNSGWMYMVNGSHRGVDGYATQILKDGDIIEWHYTDDYTKEEGSEDWTDDSGSQGVNNKDVNNTDLQKLINSISNTNMNDEEIKLKSEKVILKIIQELDKTNLTNQKKKELLKDLNKTVNILMDKVKNPETLEKILISLIDNMGKMKNILSKEDSIIQQRELISLINKSMEKGSTVKINKSDIEEIIPHINRISKFNHNLLEGIKKSEISNGKKLESILNLSIANGVKGVKISENALNNMKTSHIKYLKLDFGNETIRLFIDQLPSKGELFIEIRNMGTYTEIKITPEQTFSPALIVELPYEDNRVGNTVIREDGLGNKENLGGLYNRETKKMIFSTNKAGKYYIVEKLRGFEDLENHKWAAEDIKNMVAKGIITGREENIFAPGDNVTRAEFATLLVRGVKAIALEEKKEFEDVKESDWYFSYIQAAFENNLMQGRSKDIFDPMGYITREEMAQGVSNLLGELGYETDGLNYLDEFLDNDRISNWARKGANLTTQLNIIKGADGKFNPKQNATRAEAAVILNRLYKFIMN